VCESVDQSLSFRQLRIVRRHRRHLVFKCCSLCVYTYVYVHICIYVQKYAGMYVYMYKCVFTIAICACESSVCVRKCRSVSELSLAANCVKLSLPTLYQCCKSICEHMCICIYANMYICLFMS